MTVRPRYVRDAAGKKATIWRSGTWATLEYVGSEPGYDFHVDTRTGRYFALPQGGAR